MRCIDAIADFDLELVEQPLAADDLEGLRFVRERVSLPIMADESVWTPADALNCIRHQAVDVFNVYVSEAGGLGAAARIFAIAEAARLPCIIGSMPELGIGTAGPSPPRLCHAQLGLRQRRERLRLSQRRRHPRKAAHRRWVYPPAIRPRPRRHPRRGRPRRIPLRSARGCGD